jgi:hypothetical protein
MNTPSRDQAWAGAQKGGGVVSIGWNDQVRVFERMGKDFVMSGLNTSSGVWGTSAKI